eukprot:m.16353 g.16353  ORF g.16353 m.16353 type:complete len:177 (+) comp8063_c0_seq2:593-1123(+)
MSFSCFCFVLFGFGFFFFPTRIENTQTVTVGETSYTFTIQFSLWRTCDTITADSTSISRTNCGPTRDINVDNFQAHATADKDGAVAGLTLAAIFCILSFIGLYCHNRCALITLLLMAVIFTAAAIGCYAHFKYVSLNGHYQLQTGFGVACGAFVATFFALLGSCFLRKDFDYELLA